MPLKHLQMGVYKHLIFNSEVVGEFVGEVVGAVQVGAVLVGAVLVGAVLVGAVLVGI